MTDEIKEATLREEVRKEVRRYGAYTPDRLAQLGYLCGYAETFGHALADSSLCGNSAPKDVRERINPPEQRKRIYNAVISRVRKYPRHLPDELREEFFGLVGKLSEGEQVPAEKAKIVAGIVKEYLQDYLGGIGTVECEGKMPR